MDRAPQLSQLSSMRRPYHWPNLVDIMPAKPIQQPHSHEVVARVKDIPRQFTKQMPLAVEIRKKAGEEDVLTNLLTETMSRLDQLPDRATAERYMQLLPGYTAGTLTGDDEVFMDEAVVRQDNIHKTMAEMRTYNITILHTNDQISSIRGKLPNDSLRLEADQIDQMETGPLKSAAEAGGEILDILRRVWRERHDFTLEELRQAADWLPEFIDARTDCFTLLLNQADSYTQRFPDIADQIDTMRRASSVGINALDERGKFISDPDLNIYARPDDAPGMEEVALEMMRDTGLTEAEQIAALGRLGITTDAIRPEGVFLKNISIDSPLFSLSETRKIQQNLPKVIEAVLQMAESNPMVVEEALSMAYWKFIADQSVRILTSRVRREVNTAVATKRQGLLKQESELRAQVEDTTASVARPDPAEAIDLTLVSIIDRMRSGLDQGTKALLASRLGKLIQRTGINQKQILSLAEALNIELQGVAKPMQEQSLRQRRERIRLATQLGSDAVAPKIDGIRKELERIKDVPEPQTPSVNTTQSGTDHSNSAST